MNYYDARTAHAIEKILRVLENPPVQVVVSISVPIELTEEEVAARVRDAIAAAEAGRKRQ